MSSGTVTVLPYVPKLRQKGVGSSSGSQAERNQEIHLAMEEWHDETIAKGVALGLRFGKPAQYFLTRFYGTDAPAAAKAREPNLKNAWAWSLAQEHTTGMCSARIDGPALFNHFFSGRRPLADIRLAERAQGRIRDTQERRSLSRTSSPIGRLHCS